MGYAEAGGQNKQGSQWKDAVPHLCDNQLHEDIEEFMCRMEVAEQPPPITLQHHPDLPALALGDAQEEE